MGPMRIYEGGNCQVKEDREGFSMKKVSGLRFSKGRRGRKKGEREGRKKRGIWREGKDGREKEIGIGWALAGENTSPL